MKQKNAGFFKRHKKIAYTIIAAFILIWTIPVLLSLGDAPNTNTSSSNNTKDNIEVRPTRPIRNTAVQDSIFNPSVLDDEMTVAEEFGTLEVTYWSGDKRITADTGVDVDVIVNALDVNSCLQAKQQLLHVMTAAYISAEANKIKSVQYTAPNYLKARLVGEEGRLLEWDFGHSLFFQTLLDYNDTETWVENIGGC